MNATGRLCRKFANRFRHLARLSGRPIYPPMKTRSVAESIAAERAMAAKQAAAKKKKK